MSSLDLFQQFQIEKTRQETADIKEEIRFRKRKTQTIEERVEKLSLVTQAVWSFVKDTHHLQDSDLLQRIEQIDLEDGVKDGRVTTVVTTCLSCSRKINTRYRTCMYCRVENHKYSPFT